MGDLMITNRSRFQTFCGLLNAELRTVLQAKVEMPMGDVIVWVVVDGVEDEVIAGATNALQTRELVDHSDLAR